jgi:succinyl-diaminopimelate desuccinylase
VSFKGVPGHGAQPEKGINALKDAARLSSAIDTLPLHEHPLLGRETVCILKIEGGWLTLTIPDKATVYFDRHVVAGTTADHVEKELCDLIRSLNLASEVSFSFKEMLPDGVVYQPYLAQPDHPFITTLQASCRRITGKTVSITGMVSICDMNVLGPRINAPVVVFGPTGENVHRSREWVSLSSICDMAESLVDFFMSFSCI